MPCKRPRYYVNTTFIVDYADGDPDALGFARGRGGCFATSKLLLVELRRARPGRARELRGALRRLRARVYKVPVLRLLREAVAALHAMGVREPSVNTVFDTAHILAARRLSGRGVRCFATADEAAFKRALRLNVCAADYRTGREECPEGK